MNKRVVAITVFILLLCGCSLWAYKYWKNRPDPQVQKLQEMMATRPPENLTPEERQQRFHEIGQEMGNSRRSSASRWISSGRLGLNSDFRRELDSYFAMTPEQRVAYLRERIRRDQEREQQWARRRAEWQASQQNAAASGSQGAGGASPNNGQATSGGTSSSTASSAAGGPPNPRTPRTADQRAASRQQRLNKTSPVQRAQRVQFIQDMQTQRAAMGLPPGSGPGFFGGPPR